MAMGGTVSPRFNGEPTNSLKFKFQFTFSVSFPTFPSSELQLGFV